MPKFSMLGGANFIVNDWKWQLIRVRTLQNTIIHTRTCTYMHMHWNTTQLIDAFVRCFDADRWIIRIPSLSRIHSLTHSPFFFLSFSFIYMNLQESIYTRRTHTPKSITSNVHVAVVAAAAAAHPSNAATEADLESMLPWQRPSTHTNLSHNKYRYREYSEETKTQQSNSNDYGRIFEEKKTANCSTACLLESWIINQ